MSDVRRAAEPAPDRLEALADYFDRTDAEDLPWEEATEAAVKRPELEQITLRLPKADIAQLKTRAAKAGVGYTTYVRMIVRQYLLKAQTR